MQMMGLIGGMSFESSAVYYRLINEAVRTRLGGLTSAVVGIVFGVPSLRVRGLYLAIATLAAQFFWDWAFLRIRWSCWW